MAGQGGAAGKGTYDVAVHVVPRGQLWVAVLPWLATLARFAPLRRGVGGLIIALSARIGADVYVEGSTTRIGAVRARVEWDEDGESLVLVG